MLLCKRKWCSVFVSVSCVRSCAHGVLLVLGVFRFRVLLLLRSMVLVVAS